MDFLGWSYESWKITLGVFVTIGLFSALYKENKFYRLVEHIFLGLAAGWTLVALWAETLKESWWDKLVGVAGENGAPGTPGYWAWILLVPFGIMGYFVFSKKHNWISRVPIGIILGLWSGQQIQIWFNRYGPQISNSMKPLWPTDWSSITRPPTQILVEAGTPNARWESVPAERLAEINTNVYLTQAINNVIFVFTLVAVLSYFLFSFDVKSKVLKFTTTSGRWLLMVGFGAIFGTTVMMRFTLLIDRMHYIWIEWFKTIVLRQ